MRMHGTYQQAPLWQLLRSHDISPVSCIQSPPLRQLESSAEQLEQYKKASAEFQQKFIRERNVRRKLHEQLQVLKGNIRVVCR